MTPPVPTSTGPMLAVASPEAPHCSSSLGPENPGGPPAPETTLQGRREQTSGAGPGRIGMKVGMVIWARPCASSLGRGACGGSPQRQDRGVWGGHGELGQLGEVLGAKSHPQHCLG